DLNIFNAYVYRAEADSYQMGKFVDYLFSISRNILPIFIIDKLVKKKRIQALILLIIGLLAYSITGSKSVLFSYFIVYIGYWFYNDDRIKYIPLLMIFLLIIGLVGIKISGLSYIIDVFIRRVFFIPGLLTYYYYDFFKANPFDYF